MAHTRSSPSPAAAVQDPAEPVFAWFQQMLETEPVRRDEQGVWHVFRHADVMRVLGDPATFSSDTSSLVPPQEDFQLFSRGNIVNMDPPGHREVRTLVNQVFTPRVVAGLEPRITEVATGLLDDVAGRETFDLVDALAYPLPVTVIAEMLGVPAEDMPLFRRWADGLFSVQATDATVLPTEEMMGQVVPFMREMNDYLLERIAERRAEPADDLLGRLTTARVRDQGLEDQQIVGLAGVLLLAGHITTTALLGNAVLSFDRYPDAREQVRSDRSLVPAAIEEVLRHRTPFPRLGRITTTADVELGGRTIHARQLVIPWIGAANRDGERFPEPETFDIHRNGGAQLAFGHGIHFCLGAPLARLEGRVALNLLLDRYIDIEIDHEHTRYQNPWVMNSLLSLPVRVTPAAARRA
jgi:cytochrome P450